MESVIMRVVHLCSRKSVCYTPTSPAQHRIERRA